MIIKGISFFMPLCSLQFVSSLDYLVTSFDRLASSLDHLVSSFDGLASSLDHLFVLVMSSYLFLYLYFYFLFLFYYLFFICVKFFVLTLHFYRTQRESSTCGWSDVLECTLMFLAVLKFLVALMF